MRMAEMQTAFEKRMFALESELDEEKKLRSNALIDVERLKKLMAPK